MALPILWHPAELLSRVFAVVVGIVFRLKYDSPACREYTSVDIELVGLEEKAAKHRDYGQVLTVGQMYNALCRCHDSPIVG